MMKIPTSEKKWLALSFLAIALPLGVGVCLNRINAAPVVAIPVYPTAPKPNGYDLYVQAGAALTRAKPEVDPVRDGQEITDPKVRSKRYSLARKTAWLKQNQKAFALFERAMKTPSLALSARSLGAPMPGGQTREMARAKTIESNARWMRGDYNGALSSGLDTIQMGHDIRRGGAILPSLVGMAMGGIGRRAASDTIERIDANQAKSAAWRMEKLLDTRWDLAQALTEEKYVTQSLYLEFFAMGDWRSPDAFTLNDAPVPLKTRWRVLTISKQRIVDDIGAASDADIANAKRFYLQKKAPPALNDPFIEPYAQINDQTRLSEARDLAGDRLLMLRLALRAYRLKNAVYPPTLSALTPRYLNAIPADPFGAGEAMHYKRSGKTYELWSIGPDGVNNGGMPISPSREAPTNYAGERQFEHQFTDFGGKGDIVAGVNG